MTPKGRGPAANPLSKRARDCAVRHVALGFPPSLSSLEELKSLGNQKKKQGVHSSPLYMQCDPKKVTQPPLTLFDFLNGKQEGPLLLGVWV